jgi:exosortase/archaeosortase family protein
MGLDTWISRLAKNRRGLALMGLIIAFTGLTMVLNPTHATELAWIGISLLVAGVALLAWATWERASETVFESESVGSRLLYRLTLRGRLVRLFPVAGIGIIAADLAYNFLLSPSPALLTEDIMVLLTAAVLLGYYFVSPAHRRERDFALIFFLVLDLVLVAPLLLMRLITRNVDASVDVYSWTALAPELSSILSLLGVANSVHSVAGFTAPGLTFTPVKMSVPVTLVISTSCSGIYSFGIFASAFVAFLLTECERPSRRLWLLLVLGFFASYVANLLRMVIIVLVGYYRDSAQSDLQNLLLAHSYAGWIVFLVWLALFWGFLLKFLPVAEEKDGKESASKFDGSLRQFRSQCSLCGGPLGVAMPAARCQCGAIHHLACAVTHSRCPSCGHLLTANQVQATKGAPASGGENLR